MTFGNHFRTHIRLDTVRNNKVLINSSNIFCLRVLQTFQHTTLSRISTYNPRKELGNRFWEKQILGEFSKILILQNPVWKELGLSLVRFTRSIIFAGKLFKNKFCTEGLDCNDTAQLRNCTGCVTRRRAGGDLPGTHGAGVGSLAHVPI